MVAEVNRVSAALTQETSDGWIPAVPTQGTGMGAGSSRALAAPETGTANSLTSTTHTWGTGMDPGVGWP